MKKYLLLFSTILIILIIAGCNKKEELTMKDFGQTCFNNNLLSDEVYTQYIEKENVEAAASYSNADINLLFIIFDDEKSAKEYYKTFNLEENTDLIDKINKSNYSKLTYVVDNQYSTFIRVGKTILTGNSRIETKDEIQTLIDTFEY